MKNCNLQLEEGAAAQPMTATRLRVDGRRGLNQRRARAPDQFSIFNLQSAIFNVFRLVCAILTLCSNSALAQPVVEADILLRGGTIYDGAGGAPYTGDVAIRADRIVAVGAFTSAGRPQIVEAAGLYIAPGFIDLHSHSDRTITEPNIKANINFLRQGCTTIVTGNCGGGRVDVGRYFQILETNGIGTNVMHLAPHGSIRQQVMGTANRAPTADDLDKMRDLLHQAMRDGAVGMSTGLIYIPAAYAKTDELIEMAKVAARHGGIYASHIRGEGTMVLDSIDEALRIGREAAIPVHVSHLKAHGPDAWGMGRAAADRIEAARAAGQIVTADQYPYDASSTGLESMIIPSWAREGGSKALIKRLDDPTDGPRLLEEIEQLLASRGGPERLLIASYDADTSWVGRTITQIADESGRSAMDVSLQIIRNGGASAINFAMSEDDVRIIAARPFVATASDGSAMTPNPATNPHPRSYGTYPRKIGEYAHRRGWLSLEQAVRSSSGLPADILRLPDRGYLKPGYIADVVVFDADKLQDHATFTSPHQYATGFSRVYISGVAAVIDDQYTGALAGKVIRRPLKRELQIEN